MTKPYPIYGDKTVPAGLYLALYHGFKNDEERQGAKDWGVNGPLIGPLEFVHTTYMCHIQFQFIDPERANTYPGIDPGYPELWVSDDCVPFDGMEYGDWVVFYHTP